MHQWECIDQAFIDYSIQELLDFPGKEGCSYDELRRKSNLTQLVKHNWIKYL